MAVLKLVLVVLLCVPLVFVIWKMFTSLVDDLGKQQKFMEKLRRKNETGEELSRGERRSERKKKEKKSKKKTPAITSSPERPRDRDTMCMERMNRRNSYASLDMDNPEKYDRRPARPEPPRYIPYDADLDDRDRDYWN